MKKRILSVLMALALCLTLLPAPAWAAEDTLEGGTIVQEEQEETTPATSEQAVEDASEGGTIVQEEQEEATTEGNGQSTNTGEGEQSNSETNTLTEIWFVRKPDSIGRSYDGTTDGSMVSFGTPQFTDGTNTFELTEGTDFTAKKAFDSADAGNHTVTVEVTLIGEAAAKYKLKAGEETFTISGTINKAYPNLTVSLSETTCTVGEKLLPLLSVSGAPEDAAVTYYYTQYQTLAGNSEYEGSDVIPAIDENTAISEPGTYYVYAKSSGTKNYDEERSDTVELTVNKAVVKAASVTKADGTDGGTYESLPAALNAAQDGDTVKLLSNHTTNWSDVEASDLSTLAVVTKRLTLELNGWTVDYLEVGEVVPDEEGGILESTDGNLTIVDNIQDGSHGKIKDLQFVNGSLEIQSGQIGDSGEGKLTCNGNSGSVTVCGGTVLGLTVGEGASVTVSGGSTHAGSWFNDGTLTITGGTFGNVNFRNNGGTIAISGGTFSTIRNTGVSSNIPPMSLLAPGYAFYKDNAVQDGSRHDFLQDVTVKEHTHTMVNSKCACGFSCTHTNAEGASTIGKDGKCTVCGTQFAAGIGETYYTDVPSALMRLDKGEEAGVTQEEIHAMIEEGSASGAIEESERDMVRNVFRLDDRQVGSVMTPRSDIEWIDLQDSTEENVKKLLTSKRSRLVVASGSLSDVKGICSTRSLLQQIVDKKEIDFTQNLLPAVYVPESLSGMELLEHFKSTIVPLSLVVDEFGEVVGLVTPRDVLEAIAGEFQAETEDERMAIERPDGSWFLDGIIAIPELKDTLGIKEVPEEDLGRYNTLAGMMMLLLQRLPKTGDHVSWENWDFEVADMDGRRIDKVLATPQVVTAEPEGKA